MSESAPLTIGARVRGRRAELGLSRVELAKLMDCSPKVIARIEASGDPSAAEMKALAESLSVDVAELVGLAVGGAP